MKIKTRFAPSPTGYLHLGNIRTALYSWLLARNLGGEFVLRIEDTDSGRSNQQAIDAILDSMKWLNLNWDKGPYFQSKRLDKYNQIINEMLSKGTAYKCYCSKQQLQELRKLQIGRGEKPRYNGYCRKNYHEHHNINKPYVVRFNNPQNGMVKFHDLIRGPVEFNNQELDDLIIRRTDGSPTYNFCVVVDDFDMAITHVIRGEDHLNNTPRQINIFKALGAPIPKYAHISMIIGENNKKLSKRHDTIGVMQYRDEGFLPEALLNHLVRLGWSHGNQEIFSIDDMKKLFNLKTISKSASTFNTKKLLWLNHHYINNLPVDYVATHLAWHMKQQGINTQNGPQLPVLIKLLGKRCKTLKEIAIKYRYFYEDFNISELDMPKNYLSPISIPVLKLVYTQLKNLKEWIPISIHKVIKQTATDLQVDIGKISMLLRITITGTNQSPAIGAIMHAIGQARSLKRINLALEFIINSNNKI